MNGSISELSLETFYRVTGLLATSRPIIQLQKSSDKPAKKKFKPYPLGYIHIDIAEVRTEEGKLYLLVAIDRTCKFTYAELHEEANKMVAAQFLRDACIRKPNAGHQARRAAGAQRTL